MSEQGFDAFTRHSAESVTRRGTLATLGWAGLAALAGGSLTADAKDKKAKKAKKKAKKQIKKKSFVKCQAQAAECQTFILANGGNAAQLACCDFLAVCDFGPWLPCVQNAA